MDLGLSEKEAVQLRAMKPLIGKRVKISLSLSLFLIAAYAVYGFLLTGDGAYAGTKVWGQMTLVFLVSVIMVILGVTVSGIYTWWCRHHLDSLVISIQEGGGDE